MSELASWPDGFMWGTGASSTQTEGSAPASNWIDWERAGRAPASRDGNGFATRYADDFARYAALGLRHHRLSIEWARIEPEEGRRDRAAVEHYRSVLAAAGEAGIEPWVCLHHFTLPRWFADRGGFGVPANRTGAWARHVDFVAETFGDLVAGWKPINEPVAYAAGGWLFGTMPPGTADMAAYLEQLEAVLLADFEAALRLRQTGAPTATIHSLQPIIPVGEDAEFMASTFDASIWGSWMSALREGVLRVRGREPIERPEFANAFDLVGFSYYFTTGIAAAGPVDYPADAPVSPLGYRIWADGLRLVLERLHHELPGRQLLISEYGVGTADDTERCAYLKQGLDIAAAALADGIDIRGFFHWTGVDNYEWLHGYDVEFGLFDRDRNSRPSAELLADATGVRQTVGQ